MVFAEVQNLKKWNLKITLLLLTAYPELSVKPQLMRSRDNTSMCTLMNTILSEIMCTSEFTMCMSQMMCIGIKHFIGLQPQQSTQVERFQLKCSMSTIYHESIHRNQQSLNTGSISSNVSFREKKTFGRLLCESRQSQRQGKVFCAVFFIHHLRDCGL